jgi:integrase
MKRNGLRDATIRNVVKALKFLAKNCGLHDPEGVKDFVARLECNEGYKRNLVYAYDKYLKFRGFSWVKPKYEANNKLPKIPLEEKVSMLIANVPLKLGLAIAISRDTGLRPIELMGLRLRDVDLTSGLVYPETAKHGSGRMLKLKPSTLNMLNVYLARHPMNPNDKLFGNWNSDLYGKYFRYYRNRLAEKLGDPSLRDIRLYSLRHLFASKLYHQTNNILLVKELLGHKKIETTLIYTRLMEVRDGEYVSAIARTVEEARRLIEEGYEYVCDIDSVKLFRKRK